MSDRKTNIIFKHQTTMEDTFLPAFITTVLYKYDKRHAKTIGHLQKLQSGKIRMH